MRMLTTTALLALLTLAALAPASAMQRPGELVFLNDTGGQLTALSSGGPGSGFGASYGLNFVPGPVPVAMLVGAPAAPEGGRVFLFDRETRAPLYSVGREHLHDDVAGFGHEIAILGHYEHDDSVHWAVAAPGRADDDARAVPAAVVLVAAAGQQLGERLRVSGDPGAFFGWRVAAVDDESAGTQPWHTHFAVSAPAEDRGKREEAGIVRRFAVADGARSWKARGRQARERFGYALRFTPDLDDDGVTDLVVGAPGSRDLEPAGYVAVISGNRGKILRRIEAPPGAGLFGFALLYSDFDGDGIRDLAVGAPTTEVDGMPAAGSVFVYSGLDDSLLARFDGDAEGQWLGANISTLGDLDGDGANEIVLGASELEARRRKHRGRGLVLAASVPRQAVLQTYRGRKKGDFFGLPLFFHAPDIDGDGEFDLLASVTRIAPAYVPD